MDSVHIKFSDGTLDTDQMELSHDTRDTNHIKFPDGTMDPVLMEVPDCTINQDHTIEPVSMKFPDRTKDTDHMEFPDGLDPEQVHTKVPGGTMDRDQVHTKVPDSTMDPDQVHTKVPGDTMDPEQVHTKVPDELWIKIKSFLNAADLAKLGATSHRYNSLSKDPTLWQRLIIDVHQINNHYQSLEAVIGRATQLKFITITDEMAETFDEGSFVNGMPPNEDNNDFDENAMVTLIDKAKTTLISLTVGNNDENEIELKNETIVKFGSFSQLETLQLCGNDLSISGVKAILKLENLKVLKIPGVCCKIIIKKTVLYSKLLSV